MAGEVFWSSYESFKNSVPEDYRLLLILLFFTALVVVYSIFIFYFYKFLAKKNIFSLNLSKYNRSDHIVAAKLSAFLFYIAEYIILLPILTFFWFAVFASFLLVLSKAQSIETILIITAALVAAVRVTAYVNEDLSRDLAKMLPLTLLGLFVVDPNFFSVSAMFTRVGEVPNLFSHIPYYLLFIVSLELVMRFIDLIGNMFSEDENLGAGDDGEKD